jgi:RNA polymerase sigma-70 factor (ECF subfamily)
MKAPDVDPDTGGGAESATPASLLQRLQGDDADAWPRLLRLHGPTVEGWCRHAGLSAEDAADVGQEVFQAVARHIAGFRRERPGDSFRGWLWTVTQNKIRDHWRRQQDRARAAGGTSAQALLLQIPGADSAADDAAPPPAGAGDLYRRALQLIQAEFAERTWQAFWRVAVEDQAPAAVAAALGMTPGAVYIAKSRVLKRLREEFADLL